MAWHLAPSLAILRAEVNARWPNRDTASDGTIGDAAHAAGSSDHNPNGRDSVNAIDLDKDGISVAQVIAAAERHPSVHYWIYQRQIADRDTGFARRRYTGANPHDKHLHISIRQTRTAEQDRRPWGLTKEDEMTPDELMRADVVPAARPPHGNADYETNEKWSVGYALQAGVEAARAANANAIAATSATTALRTEVAAVKAALTELANRPQEAEPLDYDKLAAALLRAMANPAS